MKTVFEYSAGGVVFKREEGHVLWLVQRSAFELTRWELPKGHLEKGETKEEAALREVREESGIVGRIITQIDEVEYFYTWKDKKVHKTVYWYLMEYISGTTNDFDPHEVSEAHFVSFEEGFTKITFDTERQMLQKAQELVSSGDFAATRA